MQNPVSNNVFLNLKVLPWTMICLPLFVLLIGCAATRVSKTQTVYFRSIGQIPVIEGLINGKRAYFIIDTGASCSILDESLSERFDFSVIVKTNNSVYGLGGKAKINQAFNCTVEIGPLKISHRQFRTKRLDYLTSVIKEHDGIKIAGLIGSDILNHYNIGINYRNGTISF
jgi:hypothetical protein